MEQSHDIEVHQSPNSHTSTTLQLPTEILQLICEKYYEDDQPTLPGQDTPIRGYLVFKGVSPPTIERANQLLLSISRAIRSEVWGRKLVAEGILATYSLNVLSNCRYKWLWKHLRSIDVRITRHDHDLCVDRTFTDAFFENLEALRSLHVDIVLEVKFKTPPDTSDSWSRQNLVFFTSALHWESVGKLPDIVNNKYGFCRSARCFRARFGDGVELSISEKLNFRNSADLSPFYFTHEAFKVHGDRRLRLLSMNTDVFEVEKYLEPDYRAGLEAEAANYRALRALRETKAKQIENWKHLMGVGVYEDNS